jgi:hypothetical protein
MFQDIFLIETPPSGLPAISSVPGVSIPIPGVDERRDGFKFQNGYSHDWS